MKYSTHTHAYLQSNFLQLFFRCSGVAFDETMMIESFKRDLCRIASVLGRKTMPGMVVCRYAVDCVEILLVKCSICPRCFPPKRCRSYHLLRVCCDTLIKKELKIELQTFRNFTV